MKGSMLDCYLLTAHLFWLSMLLSFLTGCFFFFFGSCRFLVDSGLSNILCSIYIPFWSGTFSMVFHTAAYRTYVVWWAWLFFLWWHLYTCACDVDTSCIYLIAELPSHNIYLHSKCFLEVDWFSQDSRNYDIPSYHRNLSENSCAALPFLKCLQLLLSWLVIHAFIKSFICH